MSDLTCPYEIYLHDQKLSLSEVFFEVVASPYQNLKALFESPLHECDKCQNSTRFGSKLSSIVGGIRQLATQNSFSSQSVLCAGAIAACAYARNGLSDSVLYFLSSLAVSRIIPKLTAGFRLLLNYLHLRNNASTSTMFIRRQFMRAVLGLLVLTACGAAAFGMAKLVQKTPGMFALSSNTVGDAGFLGATVLLSMLGIKSLGRYFPAFMQMVAATDLREALRDSVARFIACVLELIKKTLRFFTKSDWVRLDNCIAYCREKYETMSQRDFERGVDFSERLLNAKGSALGFIGSEELAKNIDRACEELKAFDAQRMSVTQHANIAHRLHQLASLKCESEWVASMSKERVPPVGVMFLGPPGVGKSYAVPLFLEAVYRMMVKRNLQQDVHRGVYFTRNSDTEFYDGYTGQPFIYYSDMFRGTLSNDVKARESLARELSELQSLVDTAPYYPPFAFEPTPRKFGKGVAIAPSLVLLTSNYHCVDTLGDSYILARRFQHVFMFLQRKKQKMPDLSHLAIYRKKTPFMANGPDTGGPPFSGEYTPAAQFPVWEYELAAWPWASDWEEVSLKEMVEDVVEAYALQCGIFQNQSSVNPFLDDESERGEEVEGRICVEECESCAPGIEATCSSALGDATTSDELETGIPLPDGVDAPRAFWAMLDESRQYVDDSGVTIKLMQNGFSLRRELPDGRRQLFRWDWVNMRYMPVSRPRYDEVNLRSTGNNCLFVALQAAGVMRDVDAGELRRLCRDAWRTEPNPFKENEMISSDDFGFIAQTLQVNIRLSMTDDVIVPMNEEVLSWPTAHIRYKEGSHHYTAIFLHDTYDGWCPPLGGTINGQPLVRGGAWEASLPINLRELLNMRRKVVCRVRSAFLASLDLEHENLWMIDISKPEQRAPPGDPWVLVRDADVVLIISPKKYEDLFLCGYSLVHEALAGVADPKIERRAGVVRGENYLIVRGVPIRPLEELAECSMLPLEALVSVLGLLIRYDPESKHCFFVPFEPQWWLVHGLSASKYDLLMREQMSQWIRGVDKASEEPILTKRARGIVAAMKEFWRRNKMPIQVALAAVGVYSVYRAANPDKYCKKRHLLPEDPDGPINYESYSKNYLLYSKTDCRPPAPGLLERILGALKLKPRYIRQNGEVAAHIEDLPEFKVRCPDLIAEPVEEVDLSKVVFGFKTALYRPSNFPRVSLMRGDHEEMAVTGIHLKGGLVMFPAHIVDAATEGNELLVHGCRYDPIRSVVRYPAGHEFDIALLKRGHCGESIMLDGFAPHGFVEHNLHVRDLVEVFNLRNGRPEKQVARIADTATVQRNVKHGGRQTILTGYLVKGAEVAPGDCGALLLGKGKIIGMLVAGGEDGSLWVPLHADMIHRFVADYGDKSMPCSAAFAALARGHGAADSGNTPAISNFHHFKQSEKFDKPYEPRRSAIADELDSEGYWQPAPVSRDSYLRAVARFPTEQRGTLPDSLVEAAEYYSRLDRNHYHSLPTWRATANGCVDEACKNIVLKKVELHTSPGKPFTEPPSNVGNILPAELAGLTDKTRLYHNNNGMLDPVPELEALADRVYRSFQRGIVERWPFTMALKREIRDKFRCAEGKCRLFIMPPHHVNLAIRRVLGDWAGRYKRDGVNLGHAIGINVHSQAEWRNLFSYLRRDGFKVIAPDFSAYDTSHPIALNQLIAEKIAEHYPDDERAAVRAAVLACNVMEFYDHGCFIVRTGQASGSQITTQMNCWYSQVLFRGALNEIYKDKGAERDQFINKNFRIVCYGDDVLLAASPPVLAHDEGASLVKRIKDYLAGIGYRLTNGDKGELVKFESPGRVRFLKRLFYVSHEIVKAPLPNDELAKMLVWYDGEPEFYEEYQQNALRSFLAEVAEQSESDAKTWVERLKKAVGLDPTWQRAWHKIGGEKFYETVRTWKRCESDVLMTPELLEAVVPPRWCDSYSRSAWYSIGN